jgi:hypothetical protein
MTTPLDPLAPGGAAEDGPASTTPPGEARRVIYGHPLLLAERPTHYCPGCGHGIIHRLIAELLDELHLGPKTIGVASVGCSVFAYDYLDVDFVESPHGRAPAGRAHSCSPTRATATSPRSAQPRSSTPRHAASGSASSS